MLPRLSGFLARRPGKQDLIDEVLNDVMLTLWQQAGRFDATKRLSTWLFGIARHKAHTARVWAARALPEPLPALPCGGGPDDPKALVLRQEHARTVARALDRLPPEQRTVVMLMYSKAWII